MEKLTHSPIYGFNPNQLQEVRALSGYENVKQMSEAIDSLEDWIRKQNHFAEKNFDRAYLERLINVNKGSLELTKQRLDKTCTLRNLLPEFMCNFDVKNEFEDYCRMINFCILPRPTKDCYRILYGTIAKPHDIYDLLKHFRYCYLIYQYSLFNDYYSGLEIVIDYRQFSFSMLTSLNVIDMQKGLTMLIQVFGSRVKSIHLIITSKVVDGFLMILKKCLSDKMNKRLHVHSSHESLCQFIDKSLLPKEIGGDYEESIKELTEKLFKELCSDSHLARMKHLDKAVTIESQRLNSTFNEEYSGMPGSFKTLCVD